MPDFPATVLTERGEDLRAKCEGTSATLEYTKATVGKGELPAGGDPFSASVSTNTVTITNQKNGAVSDAEDVDTGFGISVTQQGSESLPEITEVICNAASGLSGGEYFKFDFPNLGFYLYYTVDGEGDDPMPTNRIPIVVDVAPTDTADQVAAKTQAAIDAKEVDFTDMVCLAEWVMDMDIISCEFVGDGTSKLSCMFGNLELGENLEWREIGIYADDPDLGEILYAYTNAGDNCGIIPAYGGATLAEYEPDIYTKIGTITEVSAVTVPPSGLVTLSQFNDHVQDKQAHGNQWIVITENHSASKGQKIMVDTTSDPLDVTLPDDPAANDWVGFADYAKTFDTNKLTVKRAGSGEKIQGLSEDMDVDVMGASFVLVYINTTKGWVISLV